ncbi:hypothetical protein [Brevundimonas sp.]|uniref:hypothetical protein n=1 Tax=Brevundimonas sp. TaxID=1871086 RepID=UPI002ABC8B9A|nr:hypothetical protein [Brevundimonas sp.]MDZ4364357.1 hypothetical protein [Brevundimonas sp.]
MSRLNVRHLAMLGAVALVALVAGLGLRAQPSAAQTAVCSITSGGNGSMFAVCGPNVFMCSADGCPYIGRIG